VNMMYIKTRTRDFISNFSILPTIPACLIARRAPAISSIENDRLTQKTGPEDLNRHSTPGDTRTIVCFWGKEAALLTSDTTGPWPIQESGNNGKKLGTASRRSTQQCEVCSCSSCYTVYKKINKANQLTIIVMASHRFFWLILSISSQWAWEYLTSLAGPSPRKMASYCTITLEKKSAKNPDGLPRSSVDQVSANVTKSSLLFTFGGKLEDKIYDDFHVFGEKLFHLLHSPA